MNYSSYGFILFLSTCILGSILFFVILTLMNPIVFFIDPTFLLHALIMKRWVIILNIIPTAITLWCVIKLKITQTNGIFTPFIYTILTVITYIFEMNRQLNMYSSIDFARVIFAAIFSSFLSALLASFYLPKEEEQPKESEDKESDS